MNLSALMSSRRPRVKLAASLTSLFLLCILVASCGQPQSDQGPMQAGSAIIQAQTGTSTATPTPSVPSSTPEVYLTPTPAVPLLPPGTYEAVNNAAGTATRVARLTSVPTWPPGQRRIFSTVPPRTPVNPIPSRVAGLGVIQENGQSTLPSLLGRFWNRWLAHVGGQTIYVYAGSMTDPSYHDQGIVVVVIEGENHRILSGPDTYEMPQRVGAVRITDGVGMLLTLTAENGSTFTFDVATRQWITP